MDESTQKYLAQRQVELRKDQLDFEGMLTADTRNVIFSPEEVRRLIIETQARRNELVLMVTCAQIEDNKITWSKGQAPLAEEQGK